MGTWCGCEAPTSRRCPGLAADITQEAATDLRLAVGEAVWFSVKTQEVRLHPARAAQVNPQADTIDQDVCVTAVTR